MPSDSDSSLPRARRQSPSTDRRSLEAHNDSRDRRCRRRKSLQSPVDERLPRSREGRRRDRGNSRSRSRSRNRSKDAARDRYERKRRLEHRHSISPYHHHRSKRAKDRSPSPRHSRRSRHDRHDHRSRPPSRKPSVKALPSQEATYRAAGGGGGGGHGLTEAGEAAEKQRPNFKPTGLLAREANTVAGTDVVLKYNEPPDARKPSARDDWRLFVFKGPTCLETLELRSRSCWLVGREAAVADLLVEHPSTSKQHAVLQFRYTTRTNQFGDKDARVRPYLIDLESSNGTVLNGTRIEATRFVEIMSKDIIKFGLSEREYVLMLADI